MYVQPKELGDGKKQIAFVSVREGERFGTYDHRSAETAKNAL